MKIVTSKKIINLDKFESVQYRQSLLGSDNGYPVEAIRHDSTGGGFFGGSGSTVTEEITRPTSEECAKQLVAAIAQAWINGQNVFDVDEWFATGTE